MNGQQAFEQVIIVAIAILAVALVVALVSIFTRPRRSFVASLPTRRVDSAVAPRVSANPVREFPTPSRDSIRTNFNQF